MVEFIPSITASCKYPEAIARKRYFHLYQMLKDNVISSFSYFLSDGSVIWKKENGQIVKKNGKEEITIHSLSELYTNMNFDVVISY